MCDLDSCLSIIVSNSAGIFDGCVGYWRLDGHTIQLAHLPVHPDPRQEALLQDTALAIENVCDLKSVEPCRSV